MRKYAILLAIPLVSLCTCRNSDSLGNNSSSRLIDRIRPEDFFSLSLDDITSPIIIMAQPFRTDSADYLTFLNQTDNTIRTFNLSKRAELLPMRLSDYPTSDKIEGYCLKNGNLYLYSYSGSHIYKFDVKSKERLYEYSVIDNLHANSGIPKPFAGTQYPIIVHDDCVYMTGFICTENKSIAKTRKTIIGIDESTGTLDYYQLYPQIYGKGNWGGGFFFRMPFSSEGENGNIVLSFGASDSLYVFNPEQGKSSAFYAGSDAIGRIKPYNRLSHVLPSTSKEKKWYRSVPSYDEIVYDWYGNCYYRIFRLPNNTSVKERNKPIGIITLDCNFNIVSEHIVESEEELNPYLYFFTPEGLYLQIHSASEEELCFALFKRTTLLNED